MRSPVNFAIAIGVSLALAACGGQPKVANIPGSPSSKQKGPASDWPVKIGSPYQVLGKWYYPRDDEDYDQTGLASWYGPTFHGLNTANGEVYNMEMVSAAHKTLPLPSYVEVTNLENGRKLVLRINDRGPFVGDRIIDLSRKSAEILGVEKPGTAKVRVRRIYPSEDVKMALRQNGKTSTIQMASVEKAVVAPTPVAPVAPVRTDVITRVDMPASVAVGGDVAPTPSTAGLPAISFATPRPSFIQVAAVSDAGRASWLAGFLKAYGPPVIQPTTSGLIRVRIGPYASVEEAQAVLAKVRDAGYQDARVVAADPAG